ncbi:MAG: TIGR02710 family CRISPR-associated CARF protein [Candidatus Binatia bacterium]
MPHAMIVSLGGSPEPLIKTLSDQKPAIVCFLASQASVDFVGSIKNAVSQAGVMFTHDHKVLVDDPDDLAHCYQRALACADWVSAHGVPTSEVIVDYTGGTKTMSAALVLATVNRGFRFSYVGGTQRTKGGVGIVESGSEVIHLGVNPWELFAVQERQRLAQHFNAYQFAACRTLIQDGRARLSADEQRRFDVLNILIEGYEAWDSFNHRRGLKKLEEATAKLQHLADLKAEGFLAPLIPLLAENRLFLQQLKENTQEFHTLHTLLLSDLFANAKRRLEEGKLDDTAARLYRLVEMMGQFEIQQLCNAETSNFPIEEIPEALREDFVRRYRDEKDKKIKLSLEATYRVLQEKGNEVGRRFFQDQGRFSNLQQARNQSILAHGMIPLEEKRVRELLEFVTTLIPTHDAPQFPKFIL